MRWHYDGLFLHFLILLPCVINIIKQSSLINQLLKTYLVIGVMSIIQIIYTGTQVCT